MTAVAVALRNVTKRFGSHRALDEVTLTVAARESVMILGPSGCGKTTLLRLIAGLDVPDGGEIWLGNVQAAGPHRNLLPPHRREIGFVFQDLALWPHLTVAGNLRFVLDALKVPRAERNRRIDDALQLVRIDRFATRHPHELSGAEQQRVALARALVGSPSLLLLDEPLSSLDAELRAAMRSELARLQRTLALTTVYVTHDRRTLCGSWSRRRPPGRAPRHWRTARLYFSRSSRSSRAPSRLSYGSASARLERSRSSVWSRYS